MLPDWRLLVWRCTGRDETKSISKRYISKWDLTTRYTEFQNRVQLCQEKDEHLKVQRICNDGNTTTNKSFPVILLKAECIPGTSLTKRRMSSCHNTRKEAELLHGPPKWLMRQNDWVPNTPMCGRRGREWGASNSIHSATRLLMEVMSAFTFQSWLLFSTWTVHI